MLSSEKIPLRVQRACPSLKARMAWKIHFYHPIAHLITIKPKLVMANGLKPLSKARLFHTIGTQQVDDFLGKPHHPVITIYPVSKLEEINEHPLYLLTSIVRKWQIGLGSTRLVTVFIQPAERYYADFIDRI